MEKTWWIYYLVDPRDDSVRYVGYTGRPEKRLREHINEAHCSVGNHRLHWLRELAILDLEPVYELVESFDKEDIARKEIAHIKLAKLLGWKLTNSTMGGDGVKEPSVETRAKRSKALKGKPFTESHKAAMRLRKHSAETKRKQSEAAKRRFQRNPEVQLAQLARARASKPLKST